MNRRAFTLIELLIVLTIMGILSGMVLLGMDGWIDQARVQRSVDAFVQTTTVAKQRALSTGKVHSLIINTGRADVSPSVWPGIGSGGNSSGEYWSVANHGDTRVGKFTPSAYWSEKPADQWYCLMAPWQEPGTGAWRQAVGGLPRVDSLRRPAATATLWNIRGGPVFGPRPDAAGTLPGTVRGDSNYGVLAVPADWQTAWTWDPLDLQYGPRRFLDPGTRWMASFDQPEWAETDRYFSRLQTGFKQALCAHLVAGRDTGTYEGPNTTFNFYPNEGIDRNYCPWPTSFTPSGTGFDEQPRAFVGIVSRRTRSATYTLPGEPFNDKNGNGVYDPGVDDGWTALGASDWNMNGIYDQGGRIVTYRRPTIMRFITMYKNGNVFVGEAPRLRP